jgi:hypothetical protein
MVGGKAQQGEKHPGGNQKCHVTGGQVIVVKRVVRGPEV